MTLPTILIIAGASGGHLFPALAVAEVLREKGFRCVFIVGGKKFVDQVAAADFVYETLPASAFNVRNPLRKIWAILKLLWAWGKALGLMNKYHPAAVFGTGGYATVATVLAARLSGVPVILHEQNILPGRANRFLANMADKIAVTFEASRGYLNCKSENVICTGNPIRASVIEGLQKAKQSKDPYILITGGSQGARILSDVVPEAIAQLEEDFQKKLHIHHQARQEDIERVKNVYKNLPLASITVEPFIQNMAEAIGKSHLVIARAGTSTIVENALAGRAAIYVPLTLADGHQLKNAQVAEDAGAAVILEQSIITPESLVPHLNAILQDSERRQQMEEAARTLAFPDAAKKVAILVENVAKADVMSMEGSL
ncbi:MAG: undecaprenyldiphospho-muramoylpentapeptide beta-N-acetylglucosaminyltransferase [Alphaproteobacteria bacterium]|nr:undecaprenyldiphospho-muramoylpentapeptide beta-N-acetylglucosaminyltransferase [Alphaproteobacteria bacterium]MDD9919640.1 undecaprenyldiphospho-muramoylpentapeptide beta-N-acetylglucosaminyltransferase [Alphaproteobacteria bacterium]